MQVRLLLLRVEHVFEKSVVQVDLGQVSLLELLRELLA